MAFEHIPVLSRSRRTSHARSKLRRRLQALYAGLVAHLPPGTVLYFPQHPGVAREQVLADIEPVLAAFKAVDLAVIALQTQRNQVEKLLAPLADMLVSMELALRTQLGHAHPALAHFGVKPARARRKLSATEQVAAHAQSLETRKIRRTMGKNQKKAFKAGPVAVKPKK